MSKTSKDNIGTTEDNRNSNKELANSVSETDKSIVRYIAFEDCNVKKDEKQATDIASTTIEQSEYTIVFANTPKNSLTKQEEMVEETTERRKENKTESSGGKKRIRKSYVYFALILSALIIGIGLFSLLKIGLIFRNGKALSKSFFNYAKQGDSFKLGKYEQDNNLENGAEDIEWIVVNNNNGLILAVSKYTLDNQPYNNSEDYTSVDWENCSLRKWLNSDFYDSAFSENDKKWICKTNLHNPDSVNYCVPGGNNTVDNVFLLSCEDLKCNYKDYDYQLLVMSFNETDSKMVRTVSTQNSYDALKSYYTEYAKETYIQAQNKTWKNRSEESLRESYSELEEEYGKYCSDWWLRSPGDNWYSTMLTTWNGNVLSNPSQSKSVGVRPAIIVSANIYNRLADKNDTAENSDEHAEELRDSESEEDNDTFEVNSVNIDGENTEKIISGEQELFYILNDGRLVCINYEMTSRYESGESEFYEALTWTDIKNIAYTKGIIFGLTNDGHILVTSKNNYNFDVEDIEKLTNVVDICYCNKAYLEKDEKNKGMLLCLTDDGSALMYFANGNKKIISDAISIDCAYDKFAVVREDGTVSGGNFSSDDHSDINNWADIKQVVCGNYFIAGLKNDGSVVVSGGSLSSSLDGASTIGEDGYEEKTDIKLDVSDWKDITVLSAGAHHLVGLKKDGTVLAAGMNSYGQCNTQDWKGIASIDASSNLTVAYGSDRYYITGKYILDNIFELANKWNAYSCYY